MMPSLIVLALCMLVAAYFVNYYRCFASNLAAAKQSGIPYVVSPIYTFNRFWLITHRLWLPLLHRLPSAWTSSWVGYLTPEWPWRRLHEPFETVGSDTFILVSPGHNTLFVADAEAITQFTTRRNDFPKPIEMYTSVDIYGKNVVSSEGSNWRHHRKITSPPFTEKNNHVVWMESLHQAQAMLTAWVGKDGNENRTIADVGADTMRLSLHVISRAGFGVRLLWPHEEAAGEANSSIAELQKGHAMPYKDALSLLLDNILWVFLMPRWMLANSPLKIHKVAYQSFLEWGKYMNEMYQAKRDEVKSGETREGMDLMGALVRGAGITPASPNASNGDAEKGSTSSKQLLSDSEILGNAFVFILAGHETTANTLHFSFLYLALNWATQEHLHKDIDEIFRGRPVSEWDYERDVPKLFGSMVGAVMNEELRLIPPVIGIPKSTGKGQPQPMTLNGRRVVVPGDCYITLNTAAVHRNPKYWPAGPRRSNGVPDLEDFKPERWFLDPSKSHIAAADEATDSEGEDFGGSKGRDTSETLFRPPKGAYIPFSDGGRACLGRRFAQVEVLAVLAVIFQNHTVELAVDEFATDEEVEMMPPGGPERREVWQKAADRARYLMKYGMSTMITLQMREGHVPVRFVKRGSERFAFS
ncbi:cytochrome P450 monooxygenase-like protein [Cryomyces antarcticus]